MASGQVLSSFTVTKQQLRTLLISKYKLVHFTLWKLINTIFFLFFSDKRLALKNFARSKSLPYPQDYFTFGKNPKLVCLLDQMKADQELSEKYPSQQALLNEIISASFVCTGMIFVPCSQKYSFLNGLYTALL